MPLPIDPSRYIAFLGVMAAMAFAPGPANLFAIALGMERGKRAAALGVAGLNTGTLGWFIGAAFGLGALVSAFPKFFYFLGFIGAAYILWLAFQQFKMAFSKKIEPLQKIKSKRGSAFVDGFIVQITNPKALLFFTAVLPPFLNVTKPIVPQLLMSAAGVFTLDGIAMLSYGFGGAALKKRAEDARFRRGFALAVGVLLTMAALLITSDKLSNLSQMMN